MSLLSLLETEKGEEKLNELPHEASGITQSAGDTDQHTLPSTPTIKGIGDLKYIRIL